MTGANLLDDQTTRAIISLIRQEMATSPAQIIPTRRPRFPQSAGGPTTEVDSTGPWEGTAAENIGAAAIGSVNVPVLTGLTPVDAQNVSLAVLSGKDVLVYRIPEGEQVGGTEDKFVFHAVGENCYGVRTLFGAAATEGNDKVPRFDAAGSCTNEDLIDCEPAVWNESDTTDNLEPTWGTEPGIGSETQPASHIAVGLATGMQAAFFSLNSGAGGMIAGMSDQAPAAGVRAIENMPLMIAGVPLLLGGQVMIETSDALTTDHEVIVGSTTEVNGRHFAPLMLGPEMVYEQSEQDTDATDWDVLDAGDTQIVSLALANSYTAGRSTFRYQVQLENLNAKATDFTVTIRVDGGAPVITRQVQLAGSSQLVSGSEPLDNPISAGQVITLWVNAVGTHGQSQGWVRGTEEVSKVRMAQS